MLSPNNTDNDFFRRKNSSTTCCLLESGVRCLRPAGNACYNKRIQKTVQQKRLKFVVDPGVSQMYICDHHKNMIQNYRNQQQHKSRDNNNNNHNNHNNNHNDSNRDVSYSNDKISHSEINFLMLPLSLLRRYKRHFKLISKPGCNKAQLADIVAKHFSKIQVDQKEVLTCFLYTCKSNRSQNNNSNNNNNNINNNNNNFDDSQLDESF